jgi:O-antigen ligase
VKQKIQIIFNILLILFMPFMMYINIGDTKVNFSIADFILVFTGILILFNFRELFIKKRWLFILYFAVLLLSLFLSQFFSKFNTDFLHVSNSVMLLEMVKTIVVAVYFITAFLFVTKKTYKIFLICISLGSIPVMFIGFWSYVCFLLGKDFPIKVFEIKTMRFYGTFEDPNLCAFYFIMIFFVSLLNFKVVSNKILRYGMLVICVFSFIVIILTMSRGGWLAFAGALIVFIALNVRNLKKESVIYIIPAAILILLTLNLDYSIQNGRVTREILNRVQGTLNSDTDNIDRVQLMKAAFQMGNDNILFGVGKGSFPINSYKYLGKDSARYKSQNIPHNTLLGFYSQQGLFGLLIFIILPGYILYLLIKSKKKYKVYFIPLFIGFFINSMSINVENIRFLWYVMGLMLAMEVRDIECDFAPDFIMKKRKYTVIFAFLLAAASFLYFNLTYKMAINIYVSNGKAYSKQIVAEPGNYTLAFDLQTDNHLHTVEILNGDNLLEIMEFKSAYGLVSLPVTVRDEVQIRFKSGEGWMKVKNAYLQNHDKKIPLYDYVLLPAFAENWLNERGYLRYLEEPSFNKEFDIDKNQFSNFDLLEAKVIKYSNLSHIFEFEHECEKTVEDNYQFDLLLNYSTISSILPDDYQRNIRTYRYTMYPYTSKWEMGKTYKTKMRRLLSSEDFCLYGRYYDYKNKVFTQESYFPIDYHLVKENQGILELGESKWINVKYGKDKEGNINITSNGWVETGRFKLEEGDYTITFKAKGSFLEEYSKIRVRDSYLNVVAEITLNDEMKEYTVNYHADEYKEGVSFILELVNYKAEKDVGNRKVILKDSLNINKDMESAK